MIRQWRMPILQEINEQLLYKLNDDHSFLFFFCSNRKSIGMPGFLNLTDPKKNQMGPQFQRLCIFKHKGQNTSNMFKSKYDDSLGVLIFYKLGLYQGKWILT